MPHINTSDVAALIGENRYKDAQSEIDKYRNKYLGTQIERKEDVIENIITNACSTNDISIDSSELTENTNSNTIVNELVERVLPTVNLTREEVTSNIKSKVYTGHGTKYEESVFKWIQDNIDGKLESSQKTYSVELCEFKNIKWRLVGKVDGILQNSKTYVIEIKNRQNRLFSFIPVYEVIQIQMYMYLSGLKEAKMVQHYKGTYDIVEFTYDKEFVDECLSKLVNVVLDIHNVE